MWWYELINVWAGDPSYLQRKKLGSLSWSGALLFKGHIFLSSEYSKSVHKMATVFRKIFKIRAWLKRFKAAKLWQKLYYRWTKMLEKAMTRGWDPPVGRGGYCVRQYYDRIISPAIMCPHDQFSHTFITPLNVTVPAFQYNTRYTVQLRHCWSHF